MERRARRSILASLRSVMPPLGRAKNSKLEEDLPSPCPNTCSTPNLVSMPANRRDSPISLCKSNSEEFTPDSLYMDEQSPHNSVSSLSGRISSAKAALHSGHLAHSESSLSKIDPSVYELIPGKLYITFHPNQTYTKQEIMRYPQLFFMTTNCHESYASFAKDFGPVNIGVVVRFCQALQARVNHPDLCGRPIVYYTRCNPKHQTNAVLLLAMYMMMEHKLSAQTAAACFKAIPEYPFIPFCDASIEPEGFDLTIHDCLAGFEKAVAAGWFDPGDFGQYEQFAQGDMCAVGNKFVASRGPQRHAAHSTGLYVRRFLQLGVSTVVRFSEAATFDAQELVAAGMEVVDLEIEDGAFPAPAAVEAFLDACDKAPGRVAVHCQAGLGRTGTMMALWMVRHQHFRACEAIAWLRLLRPASVVGAQKRFLLAAESARWEGNCMLRDSSKRAVPRTKSWPLAGLTSSLVGPASPSAASSSSGWRSLSPLALRSKKENLPPGGGGDGAGLSRPWPAPEARVRRKTLVRLSYPGTGSGNSEASSPASSAAATPLTPPTCQLRRAGAEASSSRRISM